jgi:hypothetical protein
MRSEDDIYLVTGVEDGWIQVDDQVWNEYLEAKRRINDGLSRMGKT